LKAEGIALKPGQLDAFYQLLHRRGYPPLEELARELSMEAGAGGDRRGEGGAGAVVPFRTKNAVSGRPGKRAQLPRAFLSYLVATEEFATVTSSVKSQHTSADGTTTKLAVQLQDGHVVESVLMRHGGRVTICVSSQVGCSMGCTFCATGTMGIRGDLSSGEILEQLVHGSRILSASVARDDDAHDEVARGKKSKAARKPHDLIRNVVFMGMGEPLNNYVQVLAACRAMLDRRTWSLAHGRVTVSTVGVVSRMRDLTRDLPEVNLALSLHAPTQDKREAIVPAARGTPVESLIAALDAHMMAGTARSRRSGAGNPQGCDRDVDGASTEAGEFDEEERRAASKKKRAMVEYVMLEGATSTLEAAHELGRLCAGRHLVVNLIPYNQTDVKDRLRCPSEARMREFRGVVASYGSFCSIRRTMGADIAGACGQLVVEEERERRGAIDIEDGPFGRGGGLRKERRAAPSRRDTRKQAIDKVDGENLGEDPWARRLVVAAAVSASLCLVSAALLLHRRKR